MMGSRMSQPPQIDRRSMQDLVDGAKRLIPRLCPEWTNHGPSDPGIALIEIFAWMTDQLIQRLNEVPEQAYDAFLGVIGFRRFPPIPAVADIMFLTSEVVPEAVIIPEGTVVGTPPTSDGHSVEFQTTADGRLHRADLRYVLTSGPDGTFIDVGNALTEPGNGFSVFEPLVPGSALLLGFGQPCAGHLLQLDVDAAIEGIGIAPSGPPIAWEAWNGEWWGPAMLRSDGTGGLQHPGRAVVALPSRVETLEIGGNPAFWLRARLTPGSAGAGTYRTSPRLHALSVAAVGLTVRATHSSAVGAEYLGTADGSPGLSFQTSRRPVLPLALDEQLVVVEPDGESIWSEVADFSASGPGDRHFTFSWDTGTVQFGPRVDCPDGSVVQHGMTPPAGADIRLAGYRVGGGTTGNVGAGTITSLRSSIPYIEAVTNLGAARGGVDAETIDNARLRAPLWLQTGDRAVTASDFERLARWAHPTIARAKCEEVDHVVHLAIVPFVGLTAVGISVEDLAVDDDVMATVAAFIDERRLLGTAVEISTPTYRGVSVVAKVAAATGRNPTLVRLRCLEVLGRLLHPVVGWTDGRGWPFGQTIDAITIATVLSSVEGVDLVEELLLFEADPMAGARLGQATNRIKLAPRELPLIVRPQLVIA